MKSVAFILLLLGTPALGQGEKPPRPGTPAIVSGSSKQTFKHKEKIDLSYDRFKDVTTLQLHYMEVGEGVYLGAFVSSKGHGVPSTDAPILLAFSLQNEKWHCLEGCNVIFMINGERLKREPAENLSREIGGPYGVTERIGILVTYDTLKTIAYGNVVEFQAGSDEAQLKGNHLLALRDFLSRIRQ